MGEIRKKTAHTILRIDIQTEFQAESKLQLSKRRRYFKFCTLSTRFTLPVIYQSIEVKWNVNRKESIDSIIQKTTWVSLLKNFQPKSEMADKLIELNETVELSWRKKKKEDKNSFHGVCLVFCRL